jgi:hypothetical protein
MIVQQVASYLRANPDKLDMNFWYDDADCTMCLCGVAIFLQHGEEVLQEYVARASESSDEIVEVGCTLLNCKKTALFIHMWDDEQREAYFDAEENRNQVAMVEVTLSVLMDNQIDERPMSKRVIDYIDANPNTIDMSTWYECRYSGNRMCVAGITYMLAYGKGELITAIDSNESDFIEFVAQRLLGLENNDLFHTYRWSVSNRNAYFIASANNDRRGMTDATIKEINRYCKA